LSKAIPWPRITPIFTYFSITAQAKPHQPERAGTGLLPNPVPPVFRASTTCFTAVWPKPRTSLSGYFFSLFRRQFVMEIRRPTATGISDQYPFDAELVEILLPSPPNLS
jgi:hypothetical protein